MSKPALQHLVVVPLGGLGNRMRVIASAKRLAQMAGARCTVIWDWQDYAALFERDPAIEVVSAIPKELHAGYEVRHILTDNEGGTWENRHIPLDGAAGIIVTSYVAFCARGEPENVHEPALLAWVPQPSEAVRKAASRFREAEFPPRGIVGLHMRRTDNREAKLRSPDRLFIEEAGLLAGEGTKIFLASDSRRTERRLLAGFPGSLIDYPKSQHKSRRWPRRFNLAKTIEDYAELLLLASCDYVLGSAYSSYSSWAMALNGSAKCRVLAIEAIVPAPRRASFARRMTIKLDLALRTRLLGK